MPNFSSKWLSQFTCPQKTYRGFWFPTASQKPGRLDYQFDEITKEINCFNFCFWLLMRLSTFLYCFWPFGLPFPQVTSSYSLFIFFSPVLFCLFCFDFGSPKNTLDIHPLCFEDVLSEYVAYLFVLFIISLIIRNHKILIYSNISVLLLYYYFLLFKKSFPNML